MAAADALKNAIQRRWSGKLGPKAQRYLGKFTHRERYEKKIVAKVLGNHGTYTVSIALSEGQLSSACSCYIGKGGGCHHVQALATTFLQDPESFTVIKPPAREEVKSFNDLHNYLKGMTLDDLVDQLKQAGISQKDFAEGIGMSSRHLSAVKSSERNNRYFHELGALKLACLWLLENRKKFPGSKKK